MIQRGLNYPTNTKNCLIRKLYGFDTGTTDDYNDEAYNFPSETLESKK